MWNNHNYIEIIFAVKSITEHQNLENRREVRHYSPIHTIFVTNLSPEAFDFLLQLVINSMPHVGFCIHKYSPNEREEGGKAIDKNKF